MDTGWERDGFFLVRGFADAGVCRAMLARAVERSREAGGVPDRRKDANVGSVEVVDHDVREAVPVTMVPGDLLVFHSHPMHCSRDDTSPAPRAARTVDRDTSPVNDWMPISTAACASGATA